MSLKSETPSILFGDIQLQAIDSCVLFRKLLKYQNFRAYSLFIMNKIAIAKLFFFFLYFKKCPLNWNDMEVEHK